MEFSEDNLSLEDYDNYQTTVLETNADSIKEIPLKANYKKWINSQSEISHISNIINLEIESSLEKNSSNIENDTKEIIKNDDDNKISEVKKEELNNNNNKYTFIYPGEGKNVKLTGSFCQWQKRYEMLKLGVCCVFDCLTEVIVLKILHSHLGESGFTSLYSWEIEK